MGAAVLSPGYIAKGKYQARVEFVGLYQLESIGDKLLLLLKAAINQIGEYEKNSQGGAN
ncbi:MAG: hypothetical protein Q4C12_08810 [Clostridia bacterium]|nr:hypothetical protein [Clostridia bacterium]